MLVYCYRERSIAYIALSQHGKPILAQHMTVATAACRKNAGLHDHYSECQDNPAYGSNRMPIKGEVADPYLIITKPLVIIPEIGERGGK
jgi:hypothetical protein